MIDYISVADLSAGKFSNDDDGELICMNHAAPAAIGARQNEQLDRY